jgi:predicted kinase
VAPAEVALAWLLESSPAIIAIPGARRPDTARSAAHAATLRLDARERAALSRALDATTRVRPAPRRRRDGAEIVMIMGIPGAGKTRAAADYVARGYVRLNRDERGGGLRALAGALDEGLRSGARRMVLDNTYLSRASRSYVIDVASRHRIPVGCVWLNTPLVQAQVNMVQRLLARAEALPSPEELRRLARTEEGMLTPTSQMRATRQLEPPSTDEGFARIEIMPFVRRPASEAAAPGVFVAAPALREPGWENSLTQSCDAAPHLVFDWNPGAEPGSLAPTVARLTALVSGPVEGALCPHGGGPPICWCRPPLPGLPLAFARANGVDPSRSILVGSRPAHRTLAATLGADYVPV